ncbi:hypothetical protein B0H10DRAFT_1316776 [Mycena sp. CBHHK59/15]|nr:hypothetical protein B0H10DRAFT_1336564 [Mycena sp. CBHHK59/15]KAJ6617428.1 hypothetical protein B0H10DRAFT_1316776 [Mycena sp. CBHHK59/15]
MLGRWCPTHAQAHSTPGPCTMSVQNDAAGACTRTVPLPSPNYADFTLRLRTDSTPRPLEWVRVQQQQHKAILMLQCNHVKNGGGGASLCITGGGSASKVDHDAKCNGPIDDAEMSKPRTEDGLRRRGWCLFALPVATRMKTTTWSGQCALPPPRESASLCMMRLMCRGCVTMSRFAAVGEADGRLSLHDLDGDLVGVAPSAEVVEELEEPEDLEPEPEDEADTKAVIGSPGKVYGGGGVSKTWDNVRIRRRAEGSAVPLLATS